MVRIPRPTPCFLEKCRYLGFIHGSQRWGSEDGTRLYTWDDLHGEIEVFNRRGYHIAVLEAKTGLPNGKKAVPGRRIDV